MSETREQFRYRLGEVSFQGRGLDSFDWKEAYEHSFDADHDMDAAEAVYAQAIRDVIDLFDSRADNAETLGDEFKADLHACFTIIDFARERGISLEDTP